MRFLVELGLSCLFKEMSPDNDNPLGPSFDHARGRRVDTNGLSLGKYGTIVYSCHAGLLASAVGRGEAMTVMRSTNHETRSSADRNASDPDCLAASASTKDSTPEAHLLGCQLASYPDP